jgi:flagellin-specific chaperone FliS
MDSSIEIREENINKFQEYFRKYGHFITNMFITVNFERTDLMKGKINSVYKYFRRYNYMLGLIVSDFEKSENPE